MKNLQLEAQRAPSARVAIAYPQESDDRASYSLIIDNTLSLASSKYRVDRRHRDIQNSVLVPVVQTRSASHRSKQQGPVSVRSRDATNITNSE